MDDVDDYDAADSRARTFCDPMNPVGPVTRTSTAVTSYHEGIGVKRRTGIVRPIRAVLAR